MGASRGSGWGWGGHRARTGSGVSDFGQQIAGGGPFKTREEAEQFADGWFYSIDNIVEKAGHRPPPTITHADFPQATERGVTGKKKKPNT